MWLGFQGLGGCFLYAKFSGNVWLLVSGSFGVVVRIWVAFGGSRIRRCYFCLCKFEVFFRRIVQHEVSGCFDFAGTWLTVEARVTGLIFALIGL